MEDDMILLTSTLMSAFFVGFLVLGIYIGRRYEKNQNAIRITESNKESLKQFMNMMNYKGINNEDRTN